MAPISGHVSWKLMGRKCLIVTSTSLIFFPALCISGVRYKGVGLSQTSGEGNVSSDRACIVKRKIWQTFPCIWCIV